MKSQRLIGLVAFILMSACATVESKHHSSFPEDQKRARDADSGMFIKQGRWGRSDGGRGGDLRFISQFVDNNKMVKLTPRAFQLGSRFGKRNDPLVNSAVPPLYTSCPSCFATEDLSCTFTGLANIFKCIRRLDDQVSSSKEQTNQQ